MLTFDRDDPMPNQSMLGSVIQTENDEEDVFDWQETLSGISEVTLASDAVPSVQLCSCNNCPIMLDPKEQVCCRSIKRWQNDYNSDGNYTFLNTIRSVQIISLNRFCFW